MASATRDHDEAEGIVFHREDDGSITATDLETGLVRGGDTRAEALAQLAEVLALHEGDGERIDDPDAFLQDELGIEPSDEDRELPDFLQ
jgi:predicted RNase H-like HicB family nuclease